jgi:hypothetical protein
MAYTPHVWAVMDGSDVEKTSWLNNLETQYDEVVAYLTAFVHTNIYSNVDANAKFYRTSAHPSGRSDSGAGCGVDAEQVDGVSLTTILNACLPAKAVGMVAATIPPGFGEWADAVPPAGNLFIKRIL